MIFGTTLRQNRTMAASADMFISQLAIRIKQIRK